MLFKKKFSNLSCFVTFWRGSGALIKECTFRVQGDNEDQDHGPARMYIEYISLWWAQWFQSFLWSFHDVQSVRGQYKSGKWRLKSGNTSFSRLVRKSQEN